MLVSSIEYFLKLYSELDCSCYVIFRAFFSLLSSWLFLLLLGPYVIFYFKKLNFCQIIRTIGPSFHVIKRGTPTMGGIIIVFSIIVSILLWANLYNRYVWYVIFILLSYGIVGFFDDYYKIKRKDSYGLSILLKYSLLSVIALFLMIVIFILEKRITGTQLMIPVFRNTIIHLGMWYILLGYFVVVGTSNAVNLSDGLDGLVIVPVVFISFGLGLIAFMFGNASFSSYLNIQHCITFEELVVVCGAIVGSGLGFLWFNTYPAQIFMGDVGSLSLGGGLGIIAVLLRQEILLVIMSFVFVLETCSVILQVLFFKLYGNRIFLMAPIHHHFELQGYHESHIVVRVWIITLILVLFSLIILKV